MEEIERGLFGIVWVEDDGVLDGEDGPGIRVDQGGISWRKDGALVVDKRHGTVLSRLSTNII